LVVRGAAQRYSGRGPGYTAPRMVIGARQRAGHARASD
jgi:hypothetical protein